MQVCAGRRVISFTPGLQTSTDQTALAFASMYMRLSLLAVVAVVVAMVANVNAVPYVRLHPLKCTFARLNIICQRASAGWIARTDASRGLTRRRWLSR